VVVVATDVVVVVVEFEVTSAPATGDRASIAREESRAMPMTLRNILAPPARRMDFMNGKKVAIVGASFILRLSCGLAVIVRVGLIVLLPPPASVECAKER
jgi:hypothetical protein